MKATVVTRFNDAILKRVFEVGEEYPAKEVGEERVELLSKPHPKTKKVYIFVEQAEQQADKVPAAETVAEKPKRTRKAPANKDGE